MSGSLDSHRHIRTLSEYRAAVADLQAVVAEADRVSVAVPYLFRDPPGPARISERFYFTMIHRRQAHPGHPVGMRSGKEWHLCLDCLDVYPSLIEEWVDLWDESLSRISVDDLVDELLVFKYHCVDMHKIAHATDIGFCIDWLRINVAADFAREFEARFTQPWNDFLNFFALYNPLNLSAQRKSIELAGESKMVTVSTPELNQTQEKLGEIAHQFYELAQFIRNVSTIVTKRFDNKLLQFGKAQARPFQTEQTLKRNQWIYDKVCEKLPYKQIIALLGDKKEWDKITSPQGIRNAAMTHAERYDLPSIPKRQDL